MSHWKPRRRRPAVLGRNLMRGPNLRPQGRERRWLGVWVAVLLFGTVPALPLAGSRAGPAAADSRVFPLPGNRFEPAWSWPLSPTPPVLRTFQAPAQRWLAGHRGVDLPAQPGTPVLSPGAGTVVFAGWVVDRPVLTVDLGAGLLASFEPVQPVQQAGQIVAEGDVLGQVAAPTVPGHCPASCLHWGVRLDGDYVNPLNYVTDRRPSVLLPLR